MTGNLFYEARWPATGESSFRTFSELAVLTKTHDFATMGDFGWDVWEIVEMPAATRGDQVAFAKEGEGQ